ncbi:dihydroxyacetone kinase [Candidozyma auris]|nr:dihydroxyacetone kinase [[Candida] auris]QEL61477.1 dihydroxyacetone kinase [[Candida] auris]
MVKHWNYPKDDDLVVTALRGLAASNPALTLIPSEKVVYNGKAASKVAIISGGGSGHEPLHAGFVGDNLLDAAVAGTIFASPSTKQIMAAVKATAEKEKGVIAVVKNYTGDVLHFGLVAERAKRDGYKVELVAVSDDVAVGRTQNEMVGRRGIAGTAVVHKTLGAASASKNATIEELAELGRSVNAALVTMGASLDRTTVPGREGGDEGETTGADTAELGLGIHNEPGEKLHPIPEATELVDLMYKRLLDKNDKERHYLDFDDNDDYVMLINNIGGTSSLELYALAHYAVSRVPLKRKPSRVYISDFVTSLSSPGFSITLFNLDKAGTNKYSKKDILGFLDAPTNAPGWKPKIYSDKEWQQPAEEVKESPVAHAEFPKSDVKIDGQQFAKNLQNAMKLLISKEPEITKYDTQVGDGDCGETLKAGAEAILAAIDSDKQFKDNLSDVVATVSAITEIVEDKMGGTSGGIYAIYLTSFAKNLKEEKAVNTQSVASAMSKALYDGLFKYTKARKGGRTLVDTLQPFVDTLVETGDVAKSIDAARKSCENTAKLQAKFGRASYVNEEEFAGGVPDPGAVGLLAILEGFTGAN